MGMVQDMLGPEYDQVAGDSVIMERTPLVIAPIPRPTQWFRHIVYDTAHRDKRLCLDDDDDDDDDEFMVDHTNNHKDDSMDEKTVVANFYYDQYTHQPKLRLNELVEIVGVMERNVVPMEENHPIHVLSSYKDAPISFYGGGNDEEEAIPVHVPRIQVLWYRKMDLDQSIVLPPLAVSGVPSIEYVATALAQALAVDTLTASAIWMTLLSLAERMPCGTPKRTPYATTLGCASLALVLPNARACHAFQKRLDRVLSSILPLLVTPQLSDDLKIPKKESGRLNPSPLQLPKGGTVLFNVSDTQPGPVSPEGLAVLQTVQELTSGHQIPYRFDGGMCIPFEADVRVFVLCTAETKSLLPCLLQVKCHPGMEDGAADLSDSTWHTIREHLAHARSGHSIDLPLELLHDAQQDFLQRRQEGRERNVIVDEMSFHRWLTLTRLIARGRRVEKAARCDWNSALQLDDAMLASFS